MSTFVISKEFTFEAAHRLPNHDGKCARLHGHSWKMRVFVGGEKLHGEGPQSGMLFDYGWIKTIVQPLVDEYLDHYFLNDSTGMINPTSENLAAWIFIQVKRYLPELIAVEVDETCTTSCRYQPV